MAFESFRRMVARRLTPFEQPSTYTPGDDSFPGIQDPVITRPVVFGVVLPPETRSVWCGASGNLDVEYHDGTTDTIPGILAGTLLPVRPRKILSTSTIVAANLRYGV